MKLTVVGFLDAPGVVGVYNPMTDQIRLQVAGGKQREESARPLENHVHHLSVGADGKISYELELLTLPADPQ